MLRVLLISVGIHMNLNAIYPNSIAQEFHVNHSSRPWSYEVATVVVERL